MGGGAAICIKSNLSFKEIYLGNISKQDDACGIKISSNRQQLSIFSIYSPPNAPLNQAMFENILTNHKNAIIIGDLNGRNKLWHCRKENKYGRDLELLINKYNLQILNTKSVTYPKGKSILDLSLASQPLNKQKHTFEVLNDQISDHQHTLTTFHNVRCKKIRVTFKKTNWDTYTEILASTDLEDTQITSKADLERATNELTLKIQKSLSAATKSITIESKPKLIMSIPSELLKLIKLKRKIYRNLQKNYSPELKKTFNALQNKIKSSMASLKSSNLKSNFIQLEQFKSSTAKHWKALNALANPNRDKRVQSYFLEDNEVIEQEDKIAECFASHLDGIFGKPTQIKIDQTPTAQPPSNPAIDTAQEITIEEMQAALSTCKASGAPGPDNITNNMLKLCPPNILRRFHSIFNASLHLHQQMVRKNSKHTNNHLGRRTRDIPTMPIRLQKKLKKNELSRPHRQNGPNNQRRLQPQEIHGLHSLRLRKGFRQGLPRRHHLQTN